MSFYDFIEIGTSDFHTEIEKQDSKVGISIEPIKYYLDRIPTKSNCIKLNLGISNYVGTCVVHYLSEKTMKTYKFPKWVRGCNSINAPHKTVQSLCRSRGIDIDQITEKQTVEVTTLQTLMIQMNVAGVYFLKIDTEGHDIVILQKFYEELKNHRYLPHVIQFESNVLTPAEEVDKMIDLFSTVGYDVTSKGHDTVLSLNLQKANKTMYTAVPNYVIRGSNSDPPHETLEGAKQYCTAHLCSGITLEDGVYQVRNGKHIEYSKGACSWVFI